MAYLQDSHQWHRVCNGDMKEVDIGITSVMAQSNYPTAGWRGAVLWGITLSLVW